MERFRKLTKYFQPLFIDFGSTAGRKEWHDGATGAFGFWGIMKRCTYRDWMQMCRTCARWLRLDIAVDARGDTLNGTIWIITACAWPQWARGNWLIGKDCFMQTHTQTGRAELIGRVVWLNDCFVERAGYIAHDCCLSLSFIAWHIASCYVSEFNHLYALFNVVKLEANVQEYRRNLICKRPRPVR